ncbi:MAG: class I SAM-dependent methyltransferase [Chlorobia bacterium]|nr:class I SAM-dependent methyltransferase [Fimbriimonadaceae bacterium]
MPSLPPNPVSEWSNYFESTISKPLHPLFSTLEPYLPKTGRAADLGCGVGHAVVWLAEKGWQVEAIDGHSQALKIAESRLSADAKERVTLTQTMLEDLGLEPGSYDLVVAAYSLFFVESKEVLTSVWTTIRESLNSGGLFLFELLGPRDDWSNDLLSHDRVEVDALLAGWEVLHFEEVEQDGHTSQGTPKHWHVFHVIARKVPSSISRHPAINF